MTSKNILFVALTFLFGAVLVACGDDTDKGKGKTSMETPAMETTPEPAMTPQPKTEMMSEPMKEESMVEGIEDNGVIYQDEIYKNWPAQ